jgi:hypothetical protein
VGIGPDDIRLLEFLAEHRVTVVWQAQARLGCTLSAAERQLRALDEAGLVVREPIFEGQPAACRITRRGLALLERELPAPQVDLKGYRHDVGVAWLWLAAQAGAFGRLDGLVSERTMRSADRRREGLGIGTSSPAPGATSRGERYGIGVTGAGPRGGLSLHYPDLMLDATTGHRVAIELELTAKGARRLDGIMLGYAAESRVDVVLYLCPTRAIGAHVAAAARRAGISDRVQVQLLAPGTPAGAPDPRRLRSRQVARDALAARPTRSPRSRAAVPER